MPSNTKILLTRSENMARIRATGNSIETLLRKEIWKRGYRYRKNDKSVFGRPDVVFKSKRIVVFCDSMFWHGGDYLKKGTLPRINRAFWKKKILNNIARDILVNKTLKKEGWIIIRLYDKQIKKDVTKCVNKIEKYLKGADVSNRI